MVPRTGLEPASPHGRPILSRLRLPIRPTRKVFVAAGARAQYREKTEEKPRLESEVLVVEVGGVEPPSKAQLSLRLRVYPVL